MSIAALLLAAEYLDRREREAEHGYASTLPCSRHFSRRQPKLKKSLGNLNRTMHNELEKNRRAHLRNCLEKLKEMVPLGPESSRHTTLGLLNKAKLFIKNLEEKEKKQEFQKEQLLWDQRYLRRRLNQLGAAIVSQKRSFSESSSLTSFSSSPSESDEVDIMGYNSNPSDTDDHNSIQSMNSDGGMTITTRRLSFMDDVAL
ncbi:max dimerization protein 1-like [Tachypleus tridentatus]|uniref:max dimerization protein 1-like n=1 Tax=Tachypleus tridentatus TaxID=6853 RepID=UPI003FD20EE0